MQHTQQTAKAKLVRNNKLNTLRLIVAFNVYELTKRGAYKFPSQRNCAYVSGDLAAADVLRTMQAAESAVNAKIVLVD